MRVMQRKKLSSLKGLSLGDVQLGLAVEANGVRAWVWETRQLWLQFKSEVLGPGPMSCQWPWVEGWIWNAFWSGRVVGAHLPLIYPFAEAAVTKYTTNWKLRTIGIYCFTVLDAGSLNSRCQQVQVPLKVLKVREKDLVQLSRSFW